MNLFRNPLGARRRFRRAPRERPSTGLQRRQSALRFGLLWAEYGGGGEAAVGEDGHEAEPDVLID